MASENPLAPLYEAHKHLQSGISLANSEVKAAQDNLLALKKADEFISSFIKDFSSNTPPAEATSSLLTTVIPSGQRIPEMVAGYKTAEFSAEKAIWASQIQTTISSSMSAFMSYLPYEKQSLFPHVEANLTANSQVIQSYEQRLTEMFDEIKPSLSQQLASAVASLRDATNPGRFSNTATHLRELFRELFVVIAPDESIKLCSWYEAAPDSKTGVTRKHRILFSIYGFLTEDFYPNNLVDQVDKLVEQFLDNVDQLSKFTHTTEAVLAAEESVALGLFQSTLQSFLILFETIKTAKEHVIDHLQTMVQEALSDLFISDFFDELDCLSSHTRPQDAEDVEVEIRKMDAEKIYFRGSGSVYCELQYGSDSDVRNGDGLEMSDSYPFTFKGWASVENPSEVHVSRDSIEIDTSSFYGEPEEPSEEEILKNIDSLIEIPMTEPAITPELVAKHNLTPEEYAHAVEILGRTPSYTELGIFSVMWSEHCSYKNTKPLLKTFPTKSPKILVGAGEENAGIIDIGDGIAIAFKIESHNHPSAVEPFQGATTGVGGIVRDIFTMGARPVCAVNSLRFGPITSDVGDDVRSLKSNSESQSLVTSTPTNKDQDVQLKNNRRLFAGVVSGIAHYGNCFGIPTVAGEVYFDKTYQGNPLVNAFCLGVLRHEQITRGAAKGVGNPVFYVGPATGRDGLAGAAFASQDLTEESAEQQRGAVQVGDPFMEKLVCEACLELLATGCVAGMQDMGAAGLTCSTCEMAARAGTGIEIELDKVPQRAPNMSSYEIMLSESQERMLIVVHKGREEEVKRIFDKWDLPWSEIGIITDTGHMKVRHGGKLVVDIPARKIADESPVYQREAVEPAYLKDVRAFRLDGIADTTTPAEDLKKLLAWPSIASKNWVYRQYDHQVRDGSVVLPGSDAAVIRIKTDSLPVMSAELAAKVGDPTVSEKLIAMTVDCNGGYVYLDPYEGAKAAVAEACRNLACSGAIPLGATDNLNMPSPLKPELFWQIKESVRGLAEGCKAFNAPVTGGNCSLYNQSPAGPIDPTPTISVVGLIEKLEHVTTQWFKDEGDAIILLGDAVEATPLQGLGGSAYLQVVHGKKNGSPPRCDLEVAKTLHTTLIGLIQSGLVKSAHDCSEGGLTVALAESCISQLIARDTPRLIGATVDLSAIKDVRLDALLFGETQSRVIISCKALDAVKVVERAKLMGVPAVQIGNVGGDKLTVKTAAGEFSAPLTELHDPWWNSIARAMA